MDFWSIFVLAILKQGLGCDFDRLTYLVNDMDSVRHAYSSELDHFGFVNSTTLSVIAWLDSVNETSGRFDASGTAILTYFSALNRR